MKKIVLGTIASICLVSNIYAYDNYMKTAIFYSVPSDLEVTSNGGTKTTFDMKSGYALEMSIGQHYSKEFDFEIQYSYDKANTKGVNANIKVHSLFLNAIYKFDIESKNMHPYIGLGLGAANYTDGTTDDTVLAYQGLLGTSFDVDYNLETFVEYKYKDFMDVELDNNSYDETAIHAIGVGLKSKF